MQDLLALVLLVPLVAASGAVEPKPFDRQKVRLGLTYITNLVTMTQTPTPENTFKVTSQMGVLGVLEGISEVAGLIGDILGVPDPDKEEAKRRFQMLLNEILNVRQDVKRLEEKLEWGNRQLQYSHVLNVISTATDLCNKIATSTSADERKRRQDRFKEHCANQGLQMSVDVLFNGLTGKGAFSENVISAFYKTSRGHRPNVVKLSSRLIQVVSGGLMSLMAYEGLVRGAGGAKDMAKDYQPRMMETKQSTESNIRRCTEEFRLNIYGDLQAYLTEHGAKPSYTISRGLETDLKEKYKWLVFVVVVYQPVTGTDRHMSSYNPLNGTARMNFPATGGKNTFVLYKGTNEPFKGAAKKASAQAILANVNTDTASRAFTNLRTRLAAAGIEYWALITFRRRYQGSVAGAAGGRLVQAYGRYMFNIALLS